MNKIKFILAIFIMTFIFSIGWFLLGKQISLDITASLFPGSHGQEVIELQQKLKNWGYYEGNTDGIYGLKTFVSVKEFQTEYGFYPNGIAGIDTLRAVGIVRVSRFGDVYAEGAGIAKEQLLARTINGEARGESYVGQVAVGAVILNRVSDAKFPKTLPGVIYQPGAFTAVADGQINTPINSSSTVIKAARDAINGWDPTGGCIYYWNPATATSKWIWSKKALKKIGKHNFAK